MSDSKADRNIASKSRERLKRIIVWVVGVVGFLAALVTVLPWIGVPPPSNVTPTSDVRGLQIVTEVIKTSAPQPTQGPTSIPISQLREVMRDDFASQTGWSTYSDNDGGAGYEERKYYVQVNKSLLFISSWRNGGIRDSGIFQVDVLGPFDGENLGAAQGIAFGWQGSYRKGITYAFIVDSAGVCRFLEGREQGWFLTGSVEVKDFNKTRGYHTMRVYVRNNEASGYVDDVFCGTYRMRHYNAGYLGVVAAPGGQGKGKYFFDNFRIYDVP